MNAKTNTTQPEDKHQLPAQVATDRQPPPDKGATTDQAEMLRRYQEQLKRMECGFG